MEAKICSPQYPSHVKGAPLKLAVFDIDGTLRSAKDSWIHLHEFLGFREEAHRHKDLFFDSKISYKEWVDLDAALWKGVHRSRILEALNSNPLKDGAAELLGWFAERNIPIIGISTGLDVFNSEIEQRFGFQYIRSNELLFGADDQCLGLANINVHEDGKGEVLAACLSQLGISAESVVAIGDGTADIQMFKRVGLSIAVAPSKATISDAAHHCIHKGSILAAVDYIDAHFALDS